MRRKDKKINLEEEYKLDIFNSYFLANQASNTSKLLINEHGSMEMFSVSRKTYKAIEDLKCTSKTF